MHLHVLATSFVACTDENNSLKHQLITVSTSCVSDGEVQH